MKDVDFSTINIEKLIDMFECDAWPDGPGKEIGQKFKDMAISLVNVNNIGGILGAQALKRLLIARNSVLLLVAESELLKNQNCKPGRFDEFSVGDLVRIIKNDKYGSRELDEWPLGCMNMPAIVEDHLANKYWESCCNETGQILVRILGYDGSTWTIGLIHPSCLERDSRRRSLIAKHMYNARKISEVIFGKEE